MVEKASFKTVEVLVNGKTEEIKMEQGTSFENKSSIYKVDEDLNLKRYDKTTNVWETASSIEMRNYQWKAFQNVANNDNDAKTYTKADIEKAMKLYEDGQFTTDMSKDLPDGYRIEKPARFTNDKMLQINVTNGKESTSATLKFQITDQVTDVKREECIKHGRITGVNFHQYEGAYTKINRAEDGRLEKVEYCIDEDDNGQAKTYDLYNYDSKGNLKSITRVTNASYMGEGWYGTLPAYHVYQINDIGKLSDEVLAENGYHNYTVEDMGVANFDGDKISYIEGLETHVDEYNPDCLYYLIDGRRMYTKGQGIIDEPHLSKFW